MLLPAPGPSCLRFFTRESIEKLFRDAGYVIDTVKRTRLGLFDTEIEIDNSQVPKEVLDLIQTDPESTTGTQFNDLAISKSNSLSVIL
jgi:hypothetical protein